MLRTIIITTSIPDFYDINIIVSGRDNWQCEVIPCFVARHPQEVA
ncbi:MAG: hypothetical protein AAFO82_10915 [Bacteroidota bacterium]